MARLAAAVIIAFAVAAPVQAPARTVDTFCTELRRIVRAIHERPPFASLSTTPAALPGFGGGCELFNDRHGLRVHCTMTAADPRHFQRLAAHTARCLPDATRTADRSDPFVVGFSAGNALILIRQHSLPGDSRGINLSYTVQPFALR